VLLSKPTSPRKVEDGFTSLRSLLLNHNGTGAVLGRRAAFTPLLLWALTLLLWLPWLGNLPLRDWDEGLVATVARSTWQQVVEGHHPFDGLIAYKWGGAYINKPPGLHWLIGGAVYNFGEADWVVRLVPCLLSSLAVPLIYWLRCGLNPTPATPDARRQRDRRALMAALILMTLLPMARHGRLAMLDGTLLSTSLLLILGWIGARHTPWKGVLAGLGATGLLMLKPPAVFGYGLIMVAISAWEQRLGISRRAWQWLGLGLTPGVAWHLWHFTWRGNDALVMWGSQGLGRITAVVGENSGGWIMPATEVLEGGWPWLLLVPTGLQWVWRHRREADSKWILGLFVGSALMVFPLRTQLPWYSHLLWPPIALLCGEGLNRLIEDGQPRWIPRTWQTIGSGLLILTVLTSLQDETWQLPLATTALAGLGLLLGGGGLSAQTQFKRRRGFIALIGGWSLALIFLWHSQLWLWELNESWDVRPLAAQVRALPKNATVLLAGPTRPSMEWYSQRSIDQFHESPTGQLRPFWLISNDPPQHCSATSEPTQGWRLWHCPPSLSPTSKP
jgi:4-amino-4-deoxy-L-arabinose transferase-like glycosyltransferase